jgi:pyruvate,orthophosphate dikinase
MEGYVMQIHDFGPGIQGVVTDKEVVGGKGSSLAIMTNMGLNVPPGCIIDIPHCQQYWKLSSAIERANMVGSLANDIVNKHITHMHKAYGFVPLFSVRSGAPVSMPGMMDTILNVGLTTVNLDTWIKRIGARATWDSYRRLILMLSTTAYGLPETVMNAPMDALKEKLGIEADTDLTAAHLKTICMAMKMSFEYHMNMTFPDNPVQQIAAAIDAVFRSWNSERAIVYRQINKLEHISGTAVTIQAMAFGNLNDNSGTGVLFTRNPSTGDDMLHGEFLQNAQGEDVVAGIRTPRPLEEMAKIDKYWNGVLTEIATVASKLEDYYKDMVDIEFTVQDHKLYVLQSRVGKRTARAAMKIATDLYDAGIIDQDMLFSRITKSQYKISKRPQVDPAWKKKPLMEGINASPGVARGVAVFTSAQAVMAREAGQDVILIRTETTPDDIAGMNAAVGILTATGGSTSHAAVVARSMDKPCVCGVTGLTVGDHHAIYNGVPINQEKDVVTICGLTGRVWVGDNVPVTAGDTAPIRKTLFDLLSGDAYQVVDLTEIEENAIPKNVALKIEHYVMQGVEPDDLIPSIAGLQVLGHNIMLDLSMDNIDNTRALRNIFTPDPLPKQYIDMVNRILAMPKNGEIDPSQVIITRAKPQIVEYLQKAGFAINKAAKSMKDLIDGAAGVEITDDFIQNVFGSKEAMAYIMELLAKDGKKISAGSRDIHPERLLFTRLAD